MCITVNLRPGDHNPWRTVTEVLPPYTLVYTWELGELGFYHQSVGPCSVKTAPCVVPAMSSTHGRLIQVNSHRSRLSCRLSARAHCHKGKPHSRHGRAWSSCANVFSRSGCPPGLRLRIWLCVRTGVTGALFRPTTSHSRCVCKLVHSSTAAIYVDARHHCTSKLLHPRHVPDARIRHGLRSTRRVSDWDERFWVLGFWCESPYSYTHTIGL